jgi:hypothetical protein
MKTKSTNQSRQGFALVFVMIIAAILLVLVGGAMTRGRLLATAALRFKMTTQREWDAQSGLERAVVRFLNKQDGSFDFTAVDGNAVAVKTTYIGTVSGAEVYDVESWATGPGGVMSGCRQTFTVNPEIITAPCPPFMVGSDTNNTSVVLSLGNNFELIVTSADGRKLYVLGSMDEGNNFTLVDAELYLRGTANGTYTADVTENYTSMPPLIVRDLILDKMSDYDAILANAGDYAEYDTGTITSFSGQTNVINGSWTINSDVTIPGSSGMLIITGDLILNKTNKKLTLPEGVEVLVGGSIIAQNKMTLAGSPQTLYVAGDMDFKNNGYISLDNNGCLLVGGDLTAKNKAAADGLVFVNGTLTAMNSLSINDGILIAGEVISKNQGAGEMTFSLDALPQWLADLLANSTVVTYGGPKNVDRTGWAAL